MVKYLVEVEADGLVDDSLVISDVFVGSSFDECLALAQGFYRGYYGDFIIKRINLV